MLDRESLLELVSRDADPALTLTMPAHRTMPEAQQNHIRFKNLLDRARERLLEYGLEAEQSARLLARAEALVDDYDFWQHQKDGLAVFSDPESFQVERVSAALPEHVSVGRGYAIRPLLPLLKPDRKFYALAAAWENVRLFSCDGHGIEQVKRADMPETIEKLSALTEIGNRVGFHPTGPTPTTRGEPTAKFHGLGTAPPEEKEKLHDHFASQLARTADELLRQRPKTELVLIADERLSGMVAKHLHADVIRSPKTQLSPAGLSPDEVAAIARDAVRAAHRGDGDAPLESLQAHLNDPKSEQAATAVDEIAQAAAMGRIADLFLDPDAELPGTLDEATGAVDARNGSGDLADALARLTLRQGGEVHAVAAGELPDGASIAALYRY